MKVDEYVEEYYTGIPKGEIKESIRKLAYQFIMEFKEKVEARNLGVTSPTSSWVSILDEQDKQWKKIAEKIPELNPKGFQKIIFNRHPDLKKVWDPKS